MKTYQGKIELFSSELVSMHDWLGHLVVIAKMTQM